MQENNAKEFFKKMEKGIMDADISEEEKNKLLKNFLFLKQQKINLLITGATGCGKSSTINALFDVEVAKVGVGVDPETMEIEKFELDNLILWDSPGLGDGKEADNRHAKNIIKLLNQTDENNELLIDLVLVILDGSTRDLGTSFELINNVIIPNLGEDSENRVLVAINQCDVAMKGKYWNYDENRPEAPLEEFLNKKVESVRKRIKESTNIDIEVIYYSAGFKEEGMEQCRPYNLTKLLSYIIKYTPKKKRLIFMQNLNQDQEMWKDNDDLEDYQQEIQKGFLDTVFDCGMDGIDTGADIGGNIGGALGRAIGDNVVGNVVEAVGEAVGGTVGAIVGGAVGLVKGAGKAIFGGGGGGGCYITTAVCEEEGKADDCYELTTFRNFRDNWLVYQEGGSELIKQYYETAPGLVRKINCQKNYKGIYKYLRENYLNPCLYFIENKENEKCKEKYMDMMLYLYEEQKKWTVKEKYNGEN